MPIKSFDTVGKNWFSSEADEHLGHIASEPLARTNSYDDRIKLVSPYQRNEAAYSQVKLAFETIKVDCSPDVVTSFRIQDKKV